MELYGLVSIIDGYAFGDAKSFSTRYVRRNNADSLAELKARLAPICKRTLRRQVLEYIKYTNRHAMVQEFIPSDDEQKMILSPTICRSPRFMHCQSRSGS